MVLSSSNGTQLTIEQLIQAQAWLLQCEDRIKEINEGTYYSTVPPVEFNATTCPELDGVLKRIKATVNRLEEIAYKKEEELSHDDER